ncbi:hypothetical protein K435DRAFT_855855 [Dendrothele bispora CBS 962.96]|uniref:Uncharacterized protein n=1 Tax=Dendrothele bispora (strain CBS 962.96) TaxID=1314807 RepID=A0A4S8MA35_DENBC|nr:hypothetical protein K435DRAFT_855855 [Dendrothele bispora CBS 962.96]
MAVQVPPAAKNAATDIESSDEYIKLVSKILLKKPSKAIIVYVDEQEIKNAKLPKKAARPHNEDGSEGDAESGEGNSEEDDDQDDSELSQIDRQLARFRGLLEAKYGSDQDNTYAYPDPVTGNMVPLTPFMMKEWSRGMYDGIATVSEPPNTSTFDPSGKLPHQNISRMFSNTPRKSKILQIYRYFLEFVNFENLAEIASPPCALSKLWGIFSQFSRLSDTFSSNILQVDTDFQGDLRRKTIIIAE